MESHSQINGGHLGSRSLESFFGCLSSFRAGNNNCTQPGNWKRRLTQSFASLQIWLLPQLKLQMEMAMLVLYTHTAKSVQLGKPIFRSQIYYSICMPTFLTVPSSSRIHRRGRKFCPRQTLPQHFSPHCLPANCSRYSFAISFAILLQLAGSTTAPGNSVCCTSWNPTSHSIVFVAK